jgi:hypothetical protein
MKIRQQRAAHFLITAMFLGSSATLSADNIYKWQDETGKWHFSDRAPDNPAIATKEAALNPINSTATAKTNAELKTVFPEKSQEEIEHGQQKESIERQQKAQLERWCQQQRQRLRAMEGPVVFVDNNGNVIPVSEQQRIARATELSNAIRRRCE